MIITWYYYNSSSIILQVNFGSSGFASIASIPGISRVVKKIIIQQISRICVMPHQIFIPLKHPMPQEVRMLLHLYGSHIWYIVHEWYIYSSKLLILQIDRCPDPIGILRVEVVQALDLMGKDIRVLQSNTSDPYAIFSIDKKEPIFTVRLMRHNFPLYQFMNLITAGIKIIMSFAITISLP